jgi:uroporphyrinogen-III synthase
MMKIELTAHEQLVIITALKKEAKRLTKFVAETNDEYFADKLQRQKALYRKIAGYDMNLPELLEEL